MGIKIKQACRKAGLDGRDFLGVKHHKCVHLVWDGFQDM